MKKIFALLFATILATQVWAEDIYDFSAVSVNGQTLYYKKITENTVSITAPAYDSYAGYTQPTGNLVIPSTVANGSKTYTVTGIGNYAFKSCYDLSSVTIPNSVTSIGEAAFSGCIGLASVTIPNSVTSIGEMAFCECLVLTSVTIPNSVTSIGEAAFYDCNGLTSVTIPKSVTEIGPGAFSECSSLTAINVEAGNTSFAVEDGVLFDFNKTKLLCCPAGKGGQYTIPSSVEEISSMAFYGCSDLTSITIPEGIKRIGDTAFRDCGLSSITFPSTLESIGERAFYNCTYLSSVTIPNSVETIGSNAFSNKTSITYSGIAEGSPWGAQDHQSDFVYKRSGDQIILTEYKGSGGEVVIPNGVTNIGDDAFRNCDNLTSISLPEGLETIGAWAFAQCDGLTTVDIPSSVIQIGSYDYDAFNGCSNLTAINVEDNNQNYSSNDGVLYNKNQTKIISYPAGKTGTTYEIPASVTEVGWSSFSGCDKLESVTIPNDVTYIGGNAFNDCSNLKSVNIPENIVIYDGTFAGCKSLTLTIPETVTFYEGPYSQNNAFQDVKKVIYKGTVVRGVYGASEAVAEFVLDGDKLVWYNGEGGAVGIPEGVVSIGAGAFKDCGNLEYIYIPSSVTSIGGNAFANDDKLKNIYVDHENPNYTSLDGVLFSGDTKSLICYPAGKTETTYKIPDFVETIGWCAFSGCDKLQSIEIPEGVKQICGYAFDNCTGLTEITIPSTVETIGSYAFMNCINLSKVFLLSENTTFDDFAFEGIEWPTIEFGKPNNGENEEEVLSYVVRNGAAVVTGHKSNIPKNLTIPSKVTIDGVEYEVKEIDNNAFYNCNTLTSVTIPDGIITIGADAFSGCTGLSKVAIPSSVATIGANAFKDVKCISYLGEATGSPWGAANLIGEFEFTDNTKTELVKYYGTGGAVVIPSTVKIIDSEAFKGCETMISVQIPEGVTSIGIDAFYGCTGLTTLAIPSSVKTIEKRAFYSCINLTSVSGGQNLQTIQEEAFYGCHHLNNIKLPDNVSSIGNKAFKYVKNVEYYGSASGKPWGALTVNGYTDGYFIFADRDKTQLTAYTGNSSRVIVPDGVQSIGMMAFFWNEDLREVELPSTVNFIGKMAFANCFGLKDANVPLAVAYIGKDAFRDCSAATISCDASSKPALWDKEWDRKAGTVVWGDGVGIASLSATNIVVYAYGNTIVVENATAEICVFDAMGRLVVETPHCDVSTKIRINTPGVYIVRVGNEAKRVMIYE